MSSISNIIRIFAQNKISFSYFYTIEITQIDLSVSHCFDTEKTAIGEQTEINISTAVQSKLLRVGVAHFYPKIYGSYK